MSDFASEIKLLVHFSSSKNGSTPSSTSRRPSSNSEKQLFNVPQTISVIIPQTASHDVAWLKNIISLSVGVPLELADKLKIELETENPFPSTKSNKNNKSYKGKNGKRNTSGNASTPKRGSSGGSGASTPKSSAVIPLSNNSLKLSDLQMEEGDCVYVCNWGKISSKRKYDISVLAHQCFMESSELVGKIYDIVKNLQVDQQDVISKVFCADIESDLLTANFVSLLDMLGFKAMEDGKNYGIPELPTGRRHQLFIELIEEHRNFDSPLRTLCYSVSKPQNESSAAINISRPHSKNIPITSSVHGMSGLRGGALNVSSASARRNHQLLPDEHKFTEDVNSYNDLDDDETILSAPVANEFNYGDEKELSHSANGILSIPVVVSRSMPVNMDLEIGWDYDDVSFSPTSGGPSRGSRRKERRRKRRERVRAIVGDSVATQIHLHPHPHVQQQGHDNDFDDDFEMEFDHDSRPFAAAAASVGHGELAYEDLVQLENVPVGVRAGVLERLPVQMLSSRDIEIFAQSQETLGHVNCRICLCDYQVGEVVMRLPCMHVYHKSCISKWLSSNNKCPQDMVQVDI